VHTKPLSLTTRRPFAAETSVEEGRTTLRVVLGEDNLLVREGFVRVLQQLPGVEVVAACSDLSTLRDAVDRLRPDVVLTDIRMPPTGTDEGVRLAKELRSTHPDIGVVVVSQHLASEYAFALFGDGTGGRAYLLKERLKDGDDLRHALHEVARGGSVVDPLVVDELLETWADGHGSPLARLTERERQILALLAEGWTNGVIAAELGITTRVVERHVNSIFAKLELTDPQHVSRRVKAALLYLADQDGYGAGSTAR
jgi:DNA-binding NarL/FixJ family response regulator